MSQKRAALGTRLAPISATACEEETSRARSTVRRFLTLTDLVVPMHHPRLLAETAVRQGAELNALLKGSEVNPMMLSSPDARICYLQFGVIVSNALRLTGNPGLGMDLGRHVNPSNLGMLGVAVTNSPDVKTALEIGIKYSRLLAPAWDLTLGISGDRAICRNWR